MNTSILKQPAIVRIWRGRTPRDRADEYEAYNYEAGIKPLIKKALGVQTFREDRENETEFMTSPIGRGAGPAPPSGAR